MRRRAAFVILVVLAVVPASAADIQTITHGQRVDLEDHLVSGKLVLFDFYADWCGPCRALEPQIKQLASRHGNDLVVRKVDVVNWNSPVSQQFRIRSIPHLKLYDRSGALIAEGGAGQVLGRLQSALGGRAFPALPRRAPRGGGSSMVVPLLVLLAIVGVVAFLILGKGRSRPAPAPLHRPVPANQGPGDGRDPRALPLWFVELQGAFEGPFTLEQLEGLLAKRQITESAQVRRRGDATWRDLKEVLDQA